MVFVLFVENIKEENKINEKETNEQTKPYMVTRYKTSNDKLTLKRSPRKRLQTYFQIPPASMRSQPCLDLRVLHAVLRAPC